MSALQNSETSHDTNSSNEARRDRARHGDELPSGDLEPEEPGVRPEKLDGPRGAFTNGSTVVPHRTQLLFWVAASILTICAAACIYFAVNNAAIRSAFQTKAALRFTIILSVTGVLGGLASSLVNNGNAFAIPALHKARSNGQLVLSTGALGDALVGGVTGNVIHLAVSGVLNYDEGAFDPSLTVTLIALGILGGFAGPNLLHGLSTRLLAQKAAEEATRKLVPAATRKAVAQATEAVQEKVQEIASKTDRLELQTLERTMVSVSASNRAPSATENALLKSGNQEVKAALRDQDAAPDGEEIPASKLLSSGFYAYKKERYSEAIIHVELALAREGSNALGPELRWSAFNQLGLAYHQRKQDGWFEKACANYEKALEAQADAAQSAATHTNYGYALLNKPDADANSRAQSAEKFDAAIKLESSVSGDSVFDIARLGRAAAAMLHQPRDDNRARQAVGKISKPEALGFLLTDGSLDRAVIDLLRSVPDIDTQKIDKIVAAASARQ